jgi:hypothetical protein
MWLQLPFVVLLALAAWISGIDSTGDPTVTWWLWAATAVAGSFFMLRLLLRR